MRTSASQPTPTSYLRTPIPLPVQAALVAHSDDRPGLALLARYQGADPAACLMALQNKTREEPES